MNRIIKFRAWDKKVGNWLLGYEYPSLGGFSMFGEMMMLGEYASLISARISDLENIALMQYTGLHDKNGKEIYEGDLMLTDDEYHDYEDGLAINALPDGKIVAADFRDGAFFGGTELLFEYATAWEIIGNIYENPDLLKV